MRARARASVLPRESPKPLIMASISPEGDSGLAFFAAGLFAACFLAFPFCTIGFFLPMRLTILEFGGERSPARPLQFGVSRPQARAPVTSMPKGSRPFRDSSDSPCDLERPEHRAERDHGHQGEDRPDDAGN